MQNSRKENKYLSRCTYYGKLKNWEYVEGAMVLQLLTYTATSYFGGSSTIRIYVPTDLEQSVERELIVGENYLIVAAPYKLSFRQTYKHRVDLLLNIFREII